MTVLDSYKNAGLFESRIEEKPALCLFGLASAKPVEVKCPLLREDEFLEQLRENALLF